MNIISQSPRWSGPESIGKVPTWLIRVVDPNQTRTGFVGAAACFAMVALLIPFLAMRAKELNFYPEGVLRSLAEPATAWVSLIALMLGGTVFAFSLVTALALVGVDWVMQYDRKQS